MGTQPDLLKAESLHFPPSFRMPEFKISTKPESRSTLCHFLSKCRTVINKPSATKDAHLLQLFVQFLKGVAFNWHVGLPKNSIAEHAT